MKILSVDKGQNPTNIEEFTAITFVTDKTELGVAGQHLRGLVTPFLERSGDRRAVYFENIADPENGAATAIGPEEVTAAVEDLVNVLGPRGLWLSRGHCVLGEGCREETTSHINYMIKQGLLPADAHDRIWWVKSTTDVRNALLIINASAQRMGFEPEVVPYLHAGRLHDLAEETNVHLHQVSGPVARGVVDKYYDKLTYRDLITEIHGDGVVVQPRFTHRQNEEIPTDQIKRLANALEFANRYPHDFDTQGPKPVLFMQTAFSAGGVGNIKVYQQKNGTLFLNDRSADQNTVVFEDVTELFSYVKELHQSVDITPFVPLVNSYTLGLMVTPDRVTVVGPLDQLLHPTTSDFLGWKSDINPLNPEKYPNLLDEIKRTYVFGKRLQDFGYTGWCDEDLLVWLGPDGKLNTARSESNLRRDGMTQLIGPILADDRLRSSFVEGELSVWQHDHIVLSTTAGRTVNSSEDLANLLSAQGISLASDKDPFGVAFMTAPVRLSGQEYRSLSMAVLAKSDEERDEVIEKVRSLLEEDPH